MINVLSLGAGQTWRIIGLAGNEWWECQIFRNFQCQDVVICCDKLTHLDKEDKGESSRVGCPSNLEYLQKHTFVPSFHSDFPAGFTGLAARDSCG